MGEAAARRLQPVPAPAPRAIGLIRVSKERDGMVSPEVQRVAISDYARARGYQITGWLEGLDESGSRARSAWWPRLDQAVEAIEAGEYDVAVVWKFSRAARHRLKWAMALDRVENAGGRLESATEQVDAGTSAGRFTRGMFGEVAAFEAERTGEGWKEAHATRVRAGKPANGKPRWGYRYDPDEKVHQPDPETGPVLADLYRRYVAGESVYALVRWLNGHGHQTSPGYGSSGGAWSDRSLRRVLDSGFAAGYFAAGGDAKRRIPPTLHRGVHEPLITEELWLAYQDARGARRARPARTERSQYLLSGLIRCARCGGAMVAGQYGARREPKYRCRTSKEQGPGVCQGGYVMARFVEARVLEWLQELAGQVDTARRAALAASTRRSEVRSEADRLAREIARVEKEMTQLALANARAPMPAVAYDSAVRELGDQLEQLQAAHEAASRSARRAVSDPALVASGLLESWETRPVEHRREVLRSLIGRVRVTTGRPRAQVAIEPVWDE